MRYGYARVSTKGQNLDEQINQLQTAGCAIIRSEKITGTRRAGRDELETLLAFLQPGDELWITRIDRLARSIQDLSNIVAELKSRGVTLKATQQPIDNSTPAGQAFLSMLGVFAEFETALRRERQMEGIAACDRSATYTGRKPVATAAQIVALRAHMTPSAIARHLNIGRSTVHRYLAGAAALGDPPVP